MKNISQDLYNKILENMPIVCVDGVAQNERGEILLLKRMKEPEMNKWWFPGGRILKGEKSLESIKRKFKEEINVNILVNDLIGITETIFETGPNDIPTHTLNLTYSVEILNIDDFYLDSDHSEFLWTKNFEELNLNTEIKSFLEKKYKKKI